MMVWRRVLVVSFTLAFAGALGGCVAAIVPVAAGALVGTQQRGKAETTPAVSDSISAPAGAKLEMTGLTELPAPDGFTRSATSDMITQFADYAIAKAGGIPASGEMESALLAAPATLGTERAKCSRSKPLAVIIDLDPPDGTFDPLSARTPDPSLAAQLARLRSAGIEIFWSSYLPKNFTEDMRAVLVETDLDPNGDDTLLTFASVGDRKQTRRESVAVTHCPIAILGDEKEDFDELYAHLRNPEIPVAPDALIGKGWFLAASFFDYEGST